MGAGCSNVKTLTHPAFSRGKVRSIDHRQSRVRIICASGHNFDHICSPDIFPLVTKGDIVNTFFQREGILVTFPKLVPQGETMGKGHASDSDCVIFTRTVDQQTWVFPPEISQTSLDIRGKDVECLLKKEGEEFQLRVINYNPFLFYPLDSLNDVRLISRYRLRLSDMNKVGTPGKGNKHTSGQIHRLGECAVAYRKVKHDGNAFYRCVITLYLEHLCRKTTPLSELQLFIEKVETRESYYALIPEHEQYQARVLSLLQTLRKVKAAFPTEALVTLQPTLQDSSIDLALINYIRLVIANFIAVHHRQQRYKRFIISDIKEVIRGVMKYGVEAEGLVKYAIPELLGVLVVQLDVSVDSDEVFETYYSPSGIGKYPILKICKGNSLTYHALYTTNVQAVDGYDLENHTYSLDDLPESALPHLIGLYHEVLPSSLHAIVT